MVSIQVLAQKNIVDLTLVKSADRNAILDILRQRVKPQIKQDVTFIVRSLQLKNDFAFLKGNVRNAVGREVDFTKTVFKKDVEEGVFDGDAVYALLKKVKGKWKYLIHAVGPTDVVYACWAYIYKAPKPLFDYNDNCGN